MDYIETKIKEFHDKFVEPIDSEFRAMNLNGEAYIVKGTAKDIEEFIREALSNKGYRENDVSAWINYGRSRKFFDYYFGKDEILKGERQRVIAQIREEILEEVVSHIGKNEGWEESEDFYREHFGLKTKPLYWRRANC